MRAALVSALFGKLSSWVFFKLQDKHSIRKIQNVFTLSAKQDRKRPNVDIEFSAKK